MGILDEAVEVGEKVAERLSVGTSKKLGRKIESEIGNEVESKLENEVGNVAKTELGKIEDETEDALKKNLIDEGKNAIGNAFIGNNNDNGNDDVFGKIKKRFSIGDEFDNSNFNSIDEDLD